MKRSFFALLVLFFLAFGTSSWSQCPEDPNDLGECDTIHVEPWPDDLQYEEAPYFVRVPIYVTCDVVDECDSISLFIIPLCYTHTNASKYCSVSAWWNTTGLVGPPADRSIFRHIIEGTDTLIHNWMMDRQEEWLGEEWDTRILNLGDEVSPFWFTMIAGAADVRWPSTTHELLITITFKLEDSMTICIDTCFWPPTNRLAWTYGCGMSTVDKIPRSGTGTSSYEVCFTTEYTDVREIQGSEDSRPSEFSLSQNYPNPFNPATNFQFSLSKSVHVKIDIFNIVGQKVRTLVDEEMKPGVYVADWDGKDENGNFVSSGIYFYKMEAGDFSDMKKMVLVK